MGFHDNSKKKSDKNNLNLKHNIKSCLVYLQDIVSHVMSTPSLILINYVVLVLLNVFMNINLKDAKGKLFFLFSARLFVLHINEFLTPTGSLF